MALTRRQLFQDDLERRLQQWAREYGLGGEKNIGWSSINILAKAGMPLGDKLPPPHIRTDADAVQAAVDALEREGGRSKAQVLRCEYFRPGMAMPARLEALLRVGVSLSKPTYYRWLEDARLFVEWRLFPGG